MEERERFVVIGAYMAVLIAVGAFWLQDLSFWEAYDSILRASGILITDYFVVGSIGAALINAGVLGLLSLALISLTKTTLSGPTIAAVFTIAGFALFGKTPINVWPIILGVAFSAWLRRERFRNYIVVALFGTALGPAVSQVAFGLELGYPLGTLLGIIVGMALPALAPHVLHNHQGFSLYNVGFTCGIVGMYLAAHLQLTGQELVMPFEWGIEAQRPLAVVFSLYFASMIVLGWRQWRESIRLWKLPGTLVTDFVTEEGFKASLFNMGAVGVMGMAYIALVGGEFNGPTLGGVFTIVGFGAFGKHVKNIWPVMLGVFLASLLSVWEPSEPGVVLAALFGTTLAPVAGGFGPILGIMAGMVHLAVVMHVGFFHAGMNLYNNGFAGGLVGTLFIGLTRWFNVSPKRD